MALVYTNIERDLETSAPIESFGQSSAFHLLEALEDLNDEDLLAMHEKLGLTDKPLPKPMPGAKPAKKPSAAPRRALSTTVPRPVRQGSESPSPDRSPPPSSSSSSRGAPRGGRGAPRGAARVPPRGVPPRVPPGGAPPRGGRGAGRGARGSRGGSGAGTENRKPVSRPLFTKPLRPPGNIWKLTFREIISSNTILGEIVHKIYSEEKKKLDEEQARLKAEADKKRQEELAQKLLEQKRKEEEERERVKFITPAAAAAPVLGDEQVPKKADNDEKKKRRRQGKKKDDEPKAPDVSAPKVEEKLDVEKYVANLREQLASGALGLYDFNEAVKAITAATAEAPPAAVVAAAGKSNFFLGVRIKTQQVIDAAQKLQERASELCAELGDGVVPLHRLHVSLLQLVLPTKEQVAAATTLLKSVSLLVKEHFPRGTVELSFDRVGHQNNKILFIGAAADDDRDRFHAFRSAIEKLFVEAKLAVPDDEEYRACATLLKAGNVRIPESVIDELASSSCGTASFEALELIPVGKFDRSGNHLVAAVCPLRPLTEEEERQQLGERLYVAIGAEEGVGEQAGKICGMLLEAHSLDEIASFISDSTTLSNRVKEALEVLRGAGEPHQDSMDAPAAFDSASMAADSEQAEPPTDFGGAWNEPDDGIMNMADYISTKASGLPEHLRLLPPRPPKEEFGGLSADELVSEPCIPTGFVFRGRPLRVGKYVY